MKDENYDNISSKYVKIMKDYNNQLSKILDEEKKIQLKQEIKNLDEIVGQENIKEKIMKLINYISFYNKTKNEINIPKPKLNFAFIGNPGTGKTTIARILSRILYFSGYAEKKKFIEITANSLIGEYVGHTAVKTKALIEKYKGGVIFIDEAYSLTKESNTNFSDDALVEILKEMEENTIFIFAGYKEEMDKFLNLNPGLKSRIFDIYNFEDYSEKELLKMLMNKFNNSNIILEKNTKEKIRENITFAKKDKRFGNGRYIENLFTKILINHANKTKNYKDIEKIKIIKEDSVPLHEPINKNLIGF